MAEITQALVRDIFNYDAATGKLIYRDRSSPWSSCEKTGPSMRSRRLGKEAGFYNRGYIAVQVAGKRMTAHRVVWLWVHGTLPSQEIDHINGNRMDNRIENLRCVDCVENMRNMGLRKDNKTGFHGVRYSKRRNNFRVEISIKNHVHFIGDYDDFNMAIEVRKAVEKFVGFHPNHGKRQGFDDGRHK